MKEILSNLTIIYHQPEDKKFLSFYFKTFNNELYFENYNELFKKNR